MPWAWPKKKRKKICWPCMIILLGVIFEKGKTCNTYEICLCRSCTLWGYKMDLFKIQSSHMLQQLHFFLNKVNSLFLTHPPVLWSYVSFQLKPYLLTFAAFYLSAFKALMFHHPIVLSANQSCRSPCVPLCVIVPYLEFSGNNTGSSMHIL